MVSEFGWRSRLFTKAKCKDEKRAVDSGGRERLMLFVNDVNWNELHFGRIWNDLLMKYVPFQYNEIIRWVVVGLSLIRRIVYLANWKIVSCRMCEVKLLMLLALCTCVASKCHWDVDVFLGGVPMQRVAYSEARKQIHKLWPEFKKKRTSSQ